MYSGLEKKNTIIVLICFLMLIIVPDLAFSQYSSVKLLGVTVEGLKTADPSIIQINSGLTQGKEITADDIQNAIKNLWSLNLFSDVEILQDKEVAGGIYLTIRVKEYPRLEKIELLGNKKIKKDDIDKELDFYRGMVVSDYQINKARKKMKKLYAEKGYLLAEIGLSIAENLLQDEC